jgi:SWI/SNF-related matrix-associated actin-dependent regulator 1 of chromatin subfamily A
LEDARHAERAAAKEKAKKSMIYAARTNLAPRSVSPPPAQPSIITEVSSQQSPNSPIVSIGRLKRPKRIAESDDEQGKSESDEGSSRGLHRAELIRTSSDEYRALAYFNGTSAEGLQELTGAPPQI